MSLTNRNTFFSLLLLLFSISLTLVILEITLRIFDIGYGSAPLDSNPILHHSHPVSYEYRVHDPTGEYGGFNIYYDEDGLSSPKYRVVKNNGDSCRIAFIGDSFTKASQVVYEDSFVGLLDRQSKCIVKNYGVSSYSPILYLLQWPFIENSFNPTHVFVQLFSNDMEDDKKYYSIAKKDENGEINSVPGPGNDWLISQLRKSYLIRLARKMQLKIKWMYQNYKVENKKIVSGIVEEVPSINDLSKSFIKKLNDKVVLSGSSFTLFVVPSKYKSMTKNYNDDDDFSDRIKKFSVDEKIEFIDLTKEFKRKSLNGDKLFFDKDAV